MSFTLREQPECLTAFLTASLIARYACTPTGLGIADLFPEKERSTSTPSGHNALFVLFFLTLFLFLYFQLCFFFFLLRSLYLYFLLCFLYFDF